MACAHTRYLPSGSGEKAYLPLLSVKTLVVIVPSFAFAETVTPAMAAPSAERTAPVSGISAPYPVVATSERTRSERMAVLLICRGRNGLEVGDEGVDSGGLEVVLEAWHARAAVGDLLAQRIVIAV